MATSQDAIDEAQSRVVEAAKSDTPEHDEAHGDLHQSAQKASNEQSAPHGSAMKEGADNERQSEALGSIGDQVKNAKDEVQNRDSSSS